MEPPSKLGDLVSRFQRNWDSYHEPGYKETELRREFLDPLFELLGWDVQNTQGWSEAYKEVIHEYAMTIGGASKAPDYCFRVGGVRKFFVEAKKPAVNLQDSPDPALQLRRYGWNAKLPLCILSDFGELIVYDTRIKPERDDNPTVARVRTFSCADYGRNWGTIYNTFSKEAVLKGSFDTFAEVTKGKKGTSAVDEAFLSEIEAWRTNLARNIAIRNPDLSQRDLNYAVQTTIDRIIFLRICEDRGIETYGRIQGLTSGQGTYDRLKDFYRLADERYNSGLFYFAREKGRPGEPDNLTLSLKIDDKTLKDLIKGLYYPASPYEFSILPAEVLGQVYEQFLGKVIRLTAGHRAEVEYKAEVKRQGGIYYTPTYVVSFIVGNVLGKLLEEKTPAEASDIRIVDQACGSGSFLITAYQHLLDWHLNWYTKNRPTTHKEAVFQGPSNSWFLTVEERRRILLNNIFGVDIDPQAVEVTKLSLLLKVLEQTSGETIDKNQKLFHERALPDLDQNIKCGNSLVAQDFYGNRQATLFDDEERFRINVFDWKAEFPQVFGPKRSNPGFDAVIGNPPYVRQESLKDLKEYFQTHYKSYDGVADLYAYFMEKGISLIRDGGHFSIIVSSSFLRTAFAENLRRVLGETASVLQIVDFGGLSIFKNAKDIYVCIPHFVKGPQPSRVSISKVKSLDFLGLDAQVAANSYEIPRERLTPDVWSLKSDEETAVFEKIAKRGIPLGEYVKGRIYYGVKTGLNEAFVIDSVTRNALIEKDAGSAELIKPLLGGENIRRWFYTQEDRWLIFTRRGIGIDRYPAIKEHLAQWQAELTPRNKPSATKGRKPGNYEWYEIQDDVAYYEAFDAPKIIFPDIAKHPRFCIDRVGAYIANTAYCLGTDDRYLLGILNSQLFWFAIGNISIPFGTRAGRFRYRLIHQYMEKVPIHVPDLKNPLEKKLHAKVISAVGDLLRLHTLLETAKNPVEKTQIGRQVEALDGEIDSTVYQLYGLSEADVEVVERDNFKSAHKTEDSSTNAD
jgi:hypothetical protein